MERLLHNWRGYVKIRLCGYSPERFLNLCNSRGLEIWDIRCVKGDYECFMSLPDFRRVKPLVKKSQARLHILERRGLPFFLYRHRKRKLSALGAACFFAVLYVMSLFIWDIQFEGNRQYTYDTLSRYLEEREIRCGMYKNGIDCGALEEGLRAAFPEIIWVSARVSGTRLLIHIKENEEASEPAPSESTPCDLVASKDGVIESMIVRQGTPQAAVGDTVKKGQVLISGIIPVEDDSGQTVRQYAVRADGDVTARTVNTYEITFPLLHTVRIPTGRTRRGFYLRAGRASFTCLFPDFQDSQWDFATQEQQLKLFSNFYLPVYIGRIRGIQVTSYERLYTDEELEALGEEKNREAVENLTEKGVQILENNDRIRKSAGNCTLSGELTTLEPIGKAVALTEETEIPVPGGEPGEMRTEE